MRLVWLTLLGAHLIAAVLWLWLMPAGFPHSSTEFWVNQVVPWIVVAWAIVALGAGAMARSATLVPPLLIAMPMFWSAFGVSAHVTFPSSSGALWALALGGGLTLLGLWLREHGLRVAHGWIAIVIAPLAAWAGWRAPITQRSPDPSTRPIATVLPTAPSGRADSKLIKLTKDAQLRPSEGRLVVRHGDHLLTVQPLQSFEARSPDCCLLSLAPPPPDDARRASPSVRSLDAVAHEAQHWSMRYRGEQPAQLDATVTRDGAIDLEASSALDQDVFTHVATYTELALTGHTRLSVQFSPVPNLRVDVPAYTERARFAYLDDAGVFHVAEATKFEKGPFIELGAGKLARDQALVIQIYDGDALIYSARFDDWAKQASTAISPTAGWGVTVNAIQLVRSGAAAGSPALITLSLASTDIGRGDQTVGHKAGVYRNRLHLETP